MPGSPSLAKSQPPGMFWAGVAMAWQRFRPTGLAPASRPPWLAPVPRRWVAEGVCGSQREVGSGRATRCTRSYLVHPAQTAAVGTGRSTPCLLSCPRCQPCPVAQRPQRGWAGDASPPEPAGRELPRGSAGHARFGDRKLSPGDVRGLGQSAGREGPVRARGYGRVRHVPRVIAALRSA